MRFLEKNNDLKRIDGMQRKSSAAGIAKRKHLRAVRKGFIDKEKEREPKPSYSKGDDYYFLHVISFNCDFLWLNIFCIRLAVLTQ